MQIFSKNHIGRIKRLAKQRKEELGIPRLVTLDQEAHKLGFPNWAAFEKASRGAIQLGPVFRRGADQMRVAFHKLSKFDGDPDIELSIRKQLPVLMDSYLSGISALTYARDYMRVALSVPRFKVSARSYAYHEMRIYLPYAFEPIAPGSDEFVPVGRHYKPLGQTDRSKWADYSAHSNLNVKLPREMWAGIRSRAGGSSGFLYNDGSTPWSSRLNAQRYLDHLEAIIELAKRHEQDVPSQVGAA
ncbi:hypothetical protein N5D77_25390 [Comamonas thiooxydans]|uniref:Uncharacterized protein n=1 Tax=Comamonas thiooxydans TaxID=363952 RepID=A0AA42Q536_9BURK|nr:hypothetical protein [Comamonas thiooxydans]MDH1337423.1 hypothetical protein [Comamonas thiooxydans]MDH1743526.1 hypothetical protein [Comamonas thiooxydans]MDH1789900.1 hypothetical protein [Comamonas thiooxydans]